MKNSKSIDLPILEYYIAKVVHLGDDENEKRALTAYLNVVDGTGDIPEELLERYFPMVCPSEGKFVGYKKILVEHIVRDDAVYKVKAVCIPAVATLLIPKDAERSSAIGRKCRASKALVKQIKPIKEYAIDTDFPYTLSEGFSMIGGIGNHPTIYRVGEIVYPDSFDTNRWHECSHGIHFFMTKEEAIQYRL